MFSGPRRGKRSSEEIRPHAPSVNRDYNGNIWPVSNIKKSVSGRLESSQAVNCVVGKKKILPKNMCSGGRTGMCKSWISNWSWCPPTERDMHTHTHRTPWQFLGTASAQLDINQMKPICDRSTPPQLYSILEQAGSSPRTRTHGRTVTPAEERLMERWRQDGKMLSSPFPRCHTGSYLTLLRVALLSAPCCDPALLIPLLFLTLRLTPPSFSVSLSSSIHERLYSISVSRSSSCFSLKPPGVLPFSHSMLLNFILLDWILLFHLVHLSPLTLTGRTLLQEQSKGHCEIGLRLHRHTYTDAW